VAAAATLVCRVLVASADLAAYRDIQVQESVVIRAKLASVDSRVIRVYRDIQGCQDTLVHRVFQESAVIRD